MSHVFFVLQPILTGLWGLFLSRRLAKTHGSVANQAALRRSAVLAGGLVWLGAMAILLSGWQPGTYLELELGWMLPPILLQLAFGADILWHHRRQVTLALLPATLYYVAADTVALHAGTWTIDPAQSLGFFLGGLLPVEEFIFFFLTNTLIVFGMVLLLATESHTCVPRLLRIPSFLSGRGDPV